MTKVKLCCDGRLSSPKLPGEGHRGLGRGTVEVAQDVDGLVHRRLALLGVLDLAEPRFPKAGVREDPEKRCPHKVLHSILLKFPAS